ncbi:MAG: VanZ family protein [bacterium]|nr:VanZ family protein [bacterium]
MKKSSAKTKKFHKSWLIIAIVWALLLTTASQIPGSSFPNYSFLSYDKLLHLSAYIPLGYFVGQSLILPYAARVIVTVLFVAVFGAVDEVHQSFVPGRYSSIYDFYADIIGGTIGVLLVRLWMSNSGAKRKKK